jgi:CRP/FNR family transcriptional regulator
MPDADALLRKTPLSVRLSEADRRRLADVATVRSYKKGELLFAEGDPSEHLFNVTSGRVKIVKMLPGGRELILELLGAGDPVGAIAVYEERPYPASAVALEDVCCVLVRRVALFALLESCPTLARGLLAGLSMRLVQLTQRLGEVAGGRVETRFAQLFLKLADRLGQPRAEGTFVPLALSRQDLADLTGTTIETSIRIMSRWGKDDVVHTDKNGFLIHARETLEQLVGA